jgi:hypothetical protein
MSPRASPASFPPIPRPLFHSTDRDLKIDLRFLPDWQHNTPVPNGWGFTIYRAAFGPGSDERFAMGVKRLEDWLRYCVRQSRYDAFGRRTDTPLDPDTDLTNTMAERLWNEVMEDYPGKEKVRTAAATAAGDEGREDFGPVGRAFVRWAEELGVDLSRRNVRYDHCLILDEAALETLEGLPADVPEVRPLPAPELGYLNPIKHGAAKAWVWILDRESMQAREAGAPRQSPEDMYPPWIRIRLPDLRTLWFWRPQELVPDSWSGVWGEDYVRHGGVSWWGESARTKNEMLWYDRNRMETMGKSAIK